VLCVLSTRQSNVLLLLAIARVLIIIIKIDERLFFEGSTQICFQTTRSKDHHSLQLRQKHPESGIDQKDSTYANGKKRGI